jgi:hypothetical protein
MDDLATRERNRRELDALAAEITELAGHLNAANYRFLKLIAEFDRRTGWSDSATQSCAHWLNWQCGIDMGAAREKVRVAHALEGLPRISAAMERGELSYSKARALTRVACAKTEEYLLEMALHGTANHVEKIVRYFRRAKASEELSVEKAQQLNRACSYLWDDDGSLVIKARLPAEAGALVMKALEAAMEEVPYVSAETPTERVFPQVRRADALALMAESFIANRLATLTGGEKHQIVVHVSAETLRDEAAGRCEIEDGAGIAAETCRRLACDCSLVHITENDEGSVLDIGRKSRSIPPALRRALKARDQACRFPGCSNSKYLDAHHIEHWAKGGETKLKNLVNLCRFHHRAVHEGGFRIQILDDGALRFVKPNGEWVASLIAGMRQRFGGWLALQVKLEHLRIDQHTAATRWRGEKMDYGMGVDVLLQQWKRPETPDRRQS